MCLVHIRRVRKRCIRRHFRQRSQNSIKPPYHIPKLPPKPLIKELVQQPQDIIPRTQHARVRIVHDDLGGGGSVPGGECDAVGGEGDHVGELGEGVGRSFEQGGGDGEVDAGEDSGGDEMVVVSDVDDEDAV